MKHIANPIHLARLVMEKTPHVLLVSDGAEEFAKSQGIELVSPYYFYTEREWKRFQGAQSDAEKRRRRVDGHGTVGVVALDMAGNLAAGTSTGGTVLKMPGRVGDSPIIGAGTYANNESCAISATGTGEYFMRNMVASDICARVRYLHVSLDQAANDVVMKELVEQHGDGGVIALDREGQRCDAVQHHRHDEGMVHPTERSSSPAGVKRRAGDRRPQMNWVRMNWATYAVLSAFFAALVAIFGKIGVQGVDSNLAVAFRTAIIVFFAWGIVVVQGNASDLFQMSRHSFLFLFLSAIATGLSWLFYYKALQLGEASRVAPD